MILKVRTLKLLCNSLLTSASQGLQFQLLLPLLHHSSKQTLLVSSQLILRTPCSVCQDNNIIFAAVKTCQPDSPLKGKLQAAGGCCAGLGTVGREAQPAKQQQPTTTTILPLAFSLPACSQEQPFLVSLHLLQRTGSTNCTSFRGSVNNFSLIIHPRSHQPTHNL